MQAWGTHRNTWDTHRTCRGTSGCMHRPYTRAHMGHVHGHTHALQRARGAGGKAADLSAIRVATAQGVRLPREVPALGAAPAEEPGRRRAGRGAQRPWCSRGRGGRAGARGQLWGQALVGRRLRALGPAPDPCLRSPCTAEPHGTAALWATRRRLGATGCCHDTPCGLRWVPCPSRGWALSATGAAWTCDLPRPTVPGAHGGHVPAPWGRVVE